MGHFDVNEFRQAMGQFATGITILSVPQGDGVHGITVNSFTSVSLDPPLILVCIDKRAKALALVREAGCFGVNVLGAEQEDISRHFANQRVREVPAARFATDASRAPRLENALCFFDCSVHSEVDAGDHVLFLGRVERLEIAAAGGQPLCYFRGRYHHGFTD